MDYASSGVDIDLEGAAVASLIGSLQRSTRKSGTPGAPVDLPGGFGGLRGLVGGSRDVQKTQGHCSAL